MSRQEILNEILKKLDLILSAYIKEPFIEDSLLKEHSAFLFYNSTLQPVKDYAKVNIDNLIGIDYQKEEIVKNTEKFIKGLPANNVLFWGERGTGKSSLVKAMLPMFADKGLKIIQVLKEDILNIFKLYPIIKNQDAYFILFIDDLSFESDEKDFKEFKTILDGGLFEIPENMLFYVTSNKKNLIPIKFSDREDSQYTRQSDILEEKLSLVDRFGLRLGFFRFDKENFIKIVKHYATIYNINMDERLLIEKALAYATEYGTFNGRTALNFIKSL